jgi:hypothetical protein
MAYPTNLDSLTDPTAGEYTNAPSHSTIHQAENAAIEALETKVGTNSSADTNSLDYKINHFSINAPEGFLINGKISPTVAGGDLTVALKTLAGTDPSATDPIYCRIGDTVRSITSAISVTKPAGTNWANMGSAEIATKECDLFVYLNYNTVDAALQIGFSRFPGATAISDFGTWSSIAEKMFEGNGSSQPAATDVVELIGRFAATLSAGAGYTWSVPTFTAVNLIQRPIYQTRMLNYTPTLIPSSGSYNSTTSNGYYVITGKMLWEQTGAHITDKGSASGCSFSNAMTINGNVMGVCRENAVTGYLWQPYSYGAITGLCKWDNTFTLANGYDFQSTIYGTIV